jgi:hypothetical protein
MVVRAVRRLVLAAAILLSAGLVSADSIKLDGGGSLSGSVTAGSKMVAVRTSTGGLMVFDRTAVKQVTRGHAATAKKTSTGAQANPEAQPKKRKLTPEEEAWMPKVRALISRLYGSDREKSQQAKNTLLNVDDPDAIPALSTHLASARDGEARHLYVVILHNMKGPKPVYYLVALSLYDPSPQIRFDARQAIRDDQFESARLLYIAALRLGSPRLARLAAVALGDIGDPRGESVPYLIDALVTYGTVATMRGLAHGDVFYTRTIYATPGLRVSDLNLSSMGQGSGSTMSGSGPSGLSNAQHASTPGGGQSGTQGQSVASASRGTAAAQMVAGSGGFTVTAMEGDLYDPPKKCGKHDRPLTGYVDHPEVLEALLKVTDQPSPGYGFDQNRWRSWWANERTNRTLQEAAHSDRAISAAGH